MSTPIRLTIVAVLLVLSSVAIRLTVSPGSGAPVRMPTKALAEIPKRIGSWSDEDIKLDPRLTAGSGAAAALERVYHSPAGHQVFLYVGVFTNFLPETGVTIPHPPQECYPGVGFRILLEQDCKVRTPDGAASLARLLTLERNGRPSYVLYWYELDGATFRTGDGLRAVLWNLRGRRSWPPMVKVILQTTAPDQQTAQQRLTEIAGPLRVWLSEYR